MAINIDEMTEGQKLDHLLIGQALIIYKLNRIEAKLNRVPKNPDTAGHSWFLQMHQIIDKIDSLIEPTKTSALNYESPQGEADLLQGE